MPVISFDTDPDALTTTVVAEFGVGLRRLWDAYADPRQIERFWGPPGYPATFTRHDVFPGGLSNYHMTSPEGERFGGFWEWLTVEAPHSFEVLDGFAQADGSPNTEMPRMRMVFEFSETESGSRMTNTTHYGSLAELEQLSAMGMEEGARAAMAQIDAVVADLTDFAAGRGTESQLLSDVQVRVSRVIRGSVDQVWAAHHDAETMKRWLLGPDGWTMPVCELAGAVGETYRYEWESKDGAQRFGFTGELLESSAPHRAVTTEAMIGMEDVATTNEMTLTAVDGGTLLSILITYPTTELRDQVLATGMVDGMETSYARLESLLG